MERSSIQWWVIGTCAFEFEAHRGIFLAQAWSSEDEVRYVHALESVWLARWASDHRKHPLPSDLGRWVDVDARLHHTSRVGHWLPSLSKLVRARNRRWSVDGPVGSWLTPGSWRASEWLFGRWLRREMKSLRREGTPQVIVNLRWWLSWSLRAAGADLLVYDCCDNFRAYPGEIPERTDWAEKRLAGMSDEVVVSSFAFGERMRGYHPRVVHIPNGVSHEVLDGLRARAERESGPLGKRPVVVYHGITMAFRFDWNLLLSVTELCPDYDIRVYTNKSHVPPGLELPPNLRVLDWLPMRELPSVLEECSLGFMPYVLAEPTLSGFPMKMFEFFAAGLPVVSTRLREVERFADAVTLCDADPQATAALIRREIEEDSQERRKARRVLAEAHGWPSLAARYRDHVASALAARPRGIDAPGRPPR